MPCDYDATNGEWAGNPVRSPFAYLDFVELTPFSLMLLAVPVGGI